MTHTEKALVCMLGSALFCLNAGALTVDATANPYQRIVDRNVFGLRPPPPPAPPPDPAANKTPAPPLRLAGITTIMGNKRALMSAQVPAKPPEPAKTVYYTLTEGQRDGDVELVAIDEKAGSVKVKNHGEMQVVIFEKEIPKFASVPAPAVGAPPSPLGGPPGVPNPGVNPAASFNPGGGPVTTFGGANTGMRTIPTRGTAGTGGLMGGLTNPTRPPQTTTHEFQHNLTREEQVILMEVERERTRNLVAEGALPPLPPTDLTPEGSAGMAPPSPFPMPPMPQ